MQHYVPTLLLLGRLQVLCVALLISATAPTRANIVDDAWGVVSDPIGIARGGDSLVTAVNRASDTLLVLQRETDADIRDYIKELSSLIARAEQAIATQRRELVAQVTADLNRFADRADSYIREAIVQAQCAVEVTLTDTLRRALGGNLRFLADDKLEIVLPFKKPSTGFSRLFLDFEEDVIEIDISRTQSPARVYEIIRDRHLQNLAYATEADQTKHIVETYADIARFARFAQCHYRNDTYGIILAREYTHYDSLVRPWTSVVSLTVGPSEKWWE